VGAYVGGFGGLMYDLFKSGVSIDFVDEVSASLTPGKAAVIADVDETWVTPIDTRLGALGGTTFRRVPGEVIDDELIRETDAARMEFEQLRAELRQASSEAKSHVEKAIEAQRRKLEALDDRIEKTLAQETAAFNARLATLREQEARAQENKRQQIGARKAELKASHEARKAKLDEARRHAKESVEAMREALVP
jgi:hypothetical protein